MSDTALPLPIRGPGVSRIIIGSLIGTTIEFYDFYIFGTAAALVLGGLFFPPSAPGSQTLAAFLTFGIAFLARPLGALLFGHFGDRLGRKSTLVASLLVTGIATILIGLLPTYGQVGFLAPVLLCLMRLAQGIGLGGEWGGAALLAVENAPSGRRGWFGMFPQLGPAIGFLLSNGIFLAIFVTLTPAQFQSWAWRLPFLASALLVVIGLYVRLRISETPAFAKVMNQRAQARVPVAEILTHHLRPLLLGSLAMVICYALFYTSTVFALGYGTHTRHIPRDLFLEMLCVAVLAMAIATPAAGALADKFGRKAVLATACALAALSGFAMAPLLGQGGPGGVQLFLIIELGLMGMTFAPMGAVLPEQFPTRVRYTGAAAAYSLGGILGASLAPYAAQLLVNHGGLPWVGYYITGAAIISLIACLLMRESAAEEMPA